MSDRTPLDEIRERLKKTVPGPWVVGENPAEIIAPCPCCGLVATCEVFGPPGTTDPDCYASTFIAHARTDIPYLLAEVSSLESQLKQAQEELATSQGRATICIQSWQRRTELAESRLQAVTEAANAAVSEYFKEEDFNTRCMYEAMASLKQNLAPPTEPTEMKP